MGRSILKRRFPILPPGIRIGDHRVVRRGGRGRAERVASGAHSRARTASRSKRRRSISACAFFGRRRRVRPLRRDSEQVAVGFGRAVSRFHERRQWNALRRQFVVVRRRLLKQKSFSVSSSVCASGSGTVTYAPTAYSERNVEVSFRPLGASTWEKLPPMTLTHSSYAFESEKVGGFDASSLVRVEDPTTGPQSVPASRTNLVRFHFALDQILRWLSDAVFKPRGRRVDVDRDDLRSDG